MINYLVGFCFLVLPVVTFKMSYDAFEYPKVILFVFMVNLVLATKLWPIINEPRKFLKPSNIDKLLIIFWGCLVTTWGINGFPAVSFWGQYYRYDGLMTLGAYLGIYFLISRFGESRVIHKVLNIAGVIFPIYILANGIMSLGFKLPIYTFFGRIAGTFGNPNFAAGFLALIFPYLLFYPKTSSKVKISVAIITLIALSLTQSRSGLLAFLTTLICYAIYQYKVSLRIIVPIGLGMLAIMFVAIPRYSPVENQLTIWQKAIKAIEKRPVTGWGMERFDAAFSSTLIPNKDFDLFKIRVDKAHNEILEYGVAGGVFTMLVYILLLVQVLVKLIRSKKSPWILANTFSLVAYLVLSQLNVLNVTEHMFLYLILASLAI